MYSFAKIAKLWFVFFKVGLMTVGGGYAMLPMLEKELVQGSKLATSEEVFESFSMAQTLPGVIGANTAALLGFKLAGFWGAMFCTLGVITPSVLIISIIAFYFKRVEHLSWVESAFKGIRIAVLALLLEAFIKLSKAAVFDKKTFTLAFLSFLLVITNWISPILLIIVGGALGFWIYRERVGS